MNSVNMKELLRKVRRKIALRHRPVVYMGDGRLLAKTKYGTRMYLDTRDIVISPIIALEGYWEPEIGDFICDFLKPGMTFVDVGANMGYFACIAAAKVGREGKVFAYEADPDVFVFLQDNLSLNWHFENVDARNVAIWSEPGEITLHRRGKYKGLTSVARIAEDELKAAGDTIEAVSVEAMPLADLIPAGVRPDLVKIDVEGAEPWVLRGSRSLLERSPSTTLLIEWSPSQIVKCGGAPSDLLDSLSGLGREIRLLEQGMRQVGATDLANVHHGTLVVGYKAG